MITKASQILFEHVASSSKERRKVLLDKEAYLQSLGVNCASCIGVCCTFQSNSMKIDFFEAIDILQDLRNKNRLNEQTLTHLRSSIDRFGLDKAVSNGVRDFGRKTYTCPFYTLEDEDEGDLGCVLSKDKKPVGCLGFNPSETNTEKGVNCFSRKSDLIAQDEKIRHIQKNSFEKFEIHTDLLDGKDYIPLKVLQVYDLFFF